ncbi:hypothetical protein COCNU_01G008510 [Cocos nucifera]|uniref:Uncharacterized protein n=1 Tax=Cocos nucifera TaxID=13894 RepID=A0A8K0HUS7_COCNU|nr:hypothetical protein COCNU_01G008510 [Cocos nucifera]
MRARWTPGPPILSDTGADSVGSCVGEASEPRLPASAAPGNAGKDLGRTCDGRRDFGRTCDGRRDFGRTRLRVQACETADPATLAHGDHRRSSEPRRGDCGSGIEEELDAQEERRPPGRAGHAGRSGTASLAGNVRNRVWGFDPQPEESWKPSR